MSSWAGSSLAPIYAGLSGITEPSEPKIGIAFSNSTCLVDYLEYRFCNKDLPSEFCDLLIMEMNLYSRTYAEKIVALALPTNIDVRFPEFCPRLWLEIDCIPIVLDHKQISRKRLFGAGNILHSVPGPGNAIQIDQAFHTHFVRRTDFENTVTPHTWSLAHRYAADLRARGVKLAVFSSAIENKEVERGRIALLRLAHCLEIDTRWYTMHPSPRVLRSVEKLHSLLQRPQIREEPLTTDEELQLLNWVERNAERDFLGPNSPLCPPQEGGVDVVVISDPVLSALARISKQQCPTRPVIFSGRIDIHDSQSESTGNKQHDAFRFVWSTLNYADVFACQAPTQLDSRYVPKSKVGYVMASVDRFDEVAKDMAYRDLAFYGRQFNKSCRDSGTAILNYPNEQYIFAQLSPMPSFQQAVSVLQAYQEFLNLLQKFCPAKHPPKLLFAQRRTNSNRNKTFFELLDSYIRHNMAELGDLVCLKQIGPPDQLWNTLLSNTKAVILLSDQEDYEERFLQALQKGKSIIRTKALGPYAFLQSEGDISVVGENDWGAMAQSLLQLETRSNEYRQKVLPQRSEKWDKVTTVGTAVSWLFLASALSNGKQVEPNEKYIDFLAQHG
ncbi:hypothetical protein N7492_009828 [Penicillium capsulatum]|uniref:Trehalose synthase N-terminal domain-containing protein n=1 Tax=Penicillium capsulatum TaxID=69766 RepID=A0A9W9HPF6_9EURO|nr:hypothetical protein N7492_009828 [Penicillium capsulatum]